MEEVITIKKIIILGILINIRIIMKFIIIKIKKGNSNVLNCVISLLKELSPKELKMVKKEIDRLNNY